MADVLSARGRRRSDRGLESRQNLALSPVFLGGKTSGNHLARLAQQYARERRCNKHIYYGWLSFHLITAGDHSA